MTKALITGGAGFIAHHTISYLLKHTDWEIITLDRLDYSCLLYTSPSPRDLAVSRMPSSA